MSSSSAPARPWRRTPGTDVRAPAAILFDLWGTLLPSPVARHDMCFETMAHELGVAAGCFAAAYRASYPERFTGATGSLETTIRSLAETCGGHPGGEQVVRAAAYRLDLMRTLLVPEQSTLDLLGELRLRRVPLALVSDSSIEAASLWTDSPLSAYIRVTAFSCQLGVRKPDRRIYLHALRRLAVAPERCLYVGDGGGGELTGAAALGLRAVRFRRPGDDPSSRYDDDRGFPGPEIDDLSQVLDLLVRQGGAAPSPSGIDP